MELIIDPPRAVGAVAIGMPFEDAVRLVHGFEGFVSQAPTGGYVSPGFAHFESGMSISLGADRSGVVECIEVYRPGQGVSVLFRKIDVFQDAEQVIRLLANEVEVVVEDDGLRVLAPQLLLALSRDVLPSGGFDETGRYFDSVLVAAPGYYGELL